MLLVQAITFRDLVAQLSRTETQSFITNLALCDPQLIIQSLTSRFISQSTTSDDNIENAKCNDIISTIIQSRDSDDNESCDDKLDTLPRRIIGICSSFLDQTSHAALSVANRSTYLGSNSPILLQELVVQYKSDSDRSLQDVSRFRFAKKLTLKVPLKDDGSDDLTISADKMNIIASQIAKMPRLQSLDLSDVNAKFIGIIANHETTNQRIKSLSASLWETERNANDEEPYDRLITSITAFKQLQFLKIYPDGHDSNEPQTRALVKSLSNFKGLDFDDSFGIEWDILQSIGHRLEYLVLHDQADRFMESAAQKQFRFNNLRELQQGDYCADNSLRQILQTAINLEKVQVHSSDLFHEILMQCERLRYLDIRGSGHTDGVLQSLERSLFSCNKMHKDALKIRINTSSWALDRCDECILKLGRLSNALSVNAVNQWMIILYLHCSKMKTSFISDLRRALAASGSDLVVLQDSNHQIILITNSDCTICGWRESWLMDL